MITLGWILLIGPLVSSLLIVAVFAATAIFQALSDFIIAPSVPDFETIILFVFLMSAFIGTILVILGGVITK